MLPFGGHEKENCGGYVARLLHLPFRQGCVDPDDLAPYLTKASPSSAQVVAFIEPGPVWWHVAYIETHSPLTVSEREGIGHPIKHNVPISEVLKREKAKNPRVSMGFFSKK